MAGPHSCFNSFFCPPHFAMDDGDGDEGEETAQASAFQFKATTVLKNTEVRAESQGTSGTSFWSNVGPIRADHWRKRRMERGGESPTSKGRRIEGEEIKVLIKFKSNISKHDISNPMRLTKVLKDAIGDVASARYVGTDKVLVFCKTKEQQEKALRLTQLGREEVECSQPASRTELRGVITGVPLSITEEMMKSCMEGGTLVKATRFNTTREGKKVPTTTILMSFSDLLLPQRVKIGYVSYPVREYVPDPLRCFKCQRLGHVAAVCKWQRRCCRCGGDHEYGKCGEGVAPKCCNCGGAHSAAYRGCAIQQQEQEVQKFKVARGVSYAEAARQVKKVNTTTTAVGMTERQNRAPVATQSHRCQVGPNAMIADKTQFLAFLAYVINCVAKVESRTERIKVIVTAAKTHLDMADVTIEQVTRILHDGNMQSSQPSE